MQQIAVLGLGTMGSGMAVNLAKAGFSVSGYNRTEARAAALVAAGGRSSATPEAAVADADAVVICLSNDDATRAVVLGSNVMEQLKPRSLVIDCGTSGLSLTSEIDAACRRAEAEFLDAPITGSKLGAESGKLTFMVGGSVSAVDRARPLFDAMGQYVVHAGLKVGDGQRIKYCLNMTQAIVLQGVLEGYALAQAQGLRLETLAEVFANSAGRTGVGQFKTPYLTTRDFTPHFRLDLMQKDLHLALRAARESDQAVPLGHAVATIYDLAAAHGWGAEDFLATVKLLEMNTGPSDPE